MILLVKILFLGMNVMMLSAICLYLWTVSWCWGLGGIAGIIGFFIGYWISPAMTIARRDYWRLPEYAVFKKKIAYANTIAGTTIVTASFITMGMAMLCKIPL